MEYQMRATVQDRHDRKSDRRTARIVGMLFLAGMVVYMTGNGLVESVLSAPDHLSVVASSAMKVAIGAMLMMLAAVFDAAHGVVMLPVLRRHNERMAFGYLGARIIDSALLAVGVLFVLLHVPLGREYLTAGLAAAPFLPALSTVLTQAHLYAYEIGMMAVGLAGSMLCYVFYKAQLVPRPVAIWGLVGYLLLLCGSALQVVGFDLRLVHAIPGGLWELFIGVWLIAKGFNPSPDPSEPATMATTGGEITPVRLS